jgi:hypothetical protein
MSVSQYLAVIRAVDFLLGGLVVPGELTGTPACLLFPVPENLPLARKSCASDWNRFNWECFHD